MRKGAANQVAHGHISLALDVRWPPPAGDEWLYRAACALDCGKFFGRFHIDPATDLQVGHEMVLVQWRRGRKLVVWPPPVSKARPCTRGRDGLVAVGV
ncbi:MAG: hypothetical protein WEE66_05095 [Actinomycetota bacterium]